MLTDEQRAVLRALTSGRANTEIARSLNMSERTLRRRVREICEAMSVETPVEAIVRAIRQELL